jgi:trk system potassium uptake protein TrkH
VLNFIIAIGITGSLGGLLLIPKPRTNSLVARDGFVIVGLGWIGISLLGALPFFFSSAVFIICIFIMKSNSTSENFDRLIYSFCFWWITLATTPICLVNANAYLLRLEQLKKLI